MTQPEAVRVCRLDDIEPGAGVCALVAGRQVAVFRLEDDSIRAVGNLDPFSQANVLARGIVGDLKGERVVASPVYKQHFSLLTGRCLEDDAVRIPVYGSRVEDEWVFVQPPIEVATTCCYCGVGCGVIATGSAGEVIAVRGDPAHPANFGRLCSKGATLHLSDDAAVRLRHPEVRTSRDAPRRRASWDDALLLAARRFAACIAEHGPDSVAFYVSGQLLTEDYYVFNKLAKGLVGTNNIDSNSRLCMSSAVAAYRLSLGADAPPCSYDDIDAASLIFIAGSNTAFAHPVLFRRIEQAKSANPALEVVVVDPRATATARAADVHLAIRPGSDVPLFNAMLHVMWRERLLDPRYIARHTEGLAHMEPLLAYWNPERAAQACGVRPAQIVDLARRFARARAALSLYCQGLNQSANGTYKNAALINLHLATGQIGRAGAGPFSLTGQPNAMGGREVGAMANLLPGHRDLGDAADRAEVARLWGVPAISARPGKTAVEMFEALRRGEIRAIWIACTNPAQSLPDTHAVRAALAAAEFVVVQEAFADAETCEFADVLLPAATWGEKDGTVTNSERRISRVRALVPPPGEARADWRIAADFAQRLSVALGREGRFAYQSPEDVFNEHRETTRARDLDITGLSYALLDAQGPQQWPFREGANCGKARLYADGRFATPTGRARFVAAQYAAPAEAADAEYPLRLNSGRLRDQWHGMSRTGRVARLMAHSPQAEIAIHPGELVRLGIDDGELVRVTSRRGALVVKVRASADVAPGDAFLPMHWGPRFMAGAGSNVLSVPALDPFSKQPELKHAAVRVERFVVGWRRVFRAPYTAALQRTASALMQRFDYAALRLVDGKPVLVRLELAHAGQPDAAALTVLQTLFGRGEETAGEEQAALVCACYGVDEAEVAAAIAAGATLEALQSRLKCGTGCGSCLPELRRAVTASAASPGSAARAP